MSGIGRATSLLKKAFVTNSGGGESSKRNNGSSDDSGKKSKWGDTNKKLAVSALVGKELVIHFFLLRTSLNNTYLYIILSSNFLKSLHIH